MKLLNRNLVPILVGLSLTTIGCVSLAFFFQSLFKKDDNKKDDTKEAQKSVHIMKSKCTTVQFKVPKKFASAIIGRGGSVIKDIQDKTGTQININDENVKSPNRICTIRGNEMESICLAESIIKNIIDNQPVIKSSELFVPYDAWRKYIISQRGSVRNIQSISGVKVIIENDYKKSETGLKRKIILKGTDNQIALATTYINNIFSCTQEKEEISSEMENSYERIKDSSLSTTNKAIEDTADNKSSEISDKQMECKTYKAIPGIGEDAVQWIQLVSGAEILMEDGFNDSLNLPCKRLTINGANDQIIVALKEIRQRSDEIWKIKKYLQQEFAAQVTLKSVLFCGNEIKNIINDQLNNKRYEMFMSHEIYERIAKKDGETIRELQSSSGAEIIIENDSNKLEDSKKKITIQGTNTQILTAIRQMADKFPDEIQIPAQNEKLIKDARNIMTYEMLVPLVSCTRIQEALQQMQDISGAEIIMDIDSYNSQNERKITITGNINQIGYIVFEIKDKVRLEFECQAEYKIMEYRKKIPNFEQLIYKSDDNMHESIRKYYEDILQDDYLEVLVSASRTPNEFWIQIIISENHDLSVLLSNMIEYYDKEENRELHVLKKISVGQMVVIRQDDKWYRAKVISVNTNGCEVFFVDYGGSKKVLMNDVLELRTDFLCLRVQAMECSLANVKPRESEWSSDACQKFDELVSLKQQKCLFAKIRSYKKRPDSYGFKREAIIPLLELYDKIDDKYVNIGEILISLGFAEYEEIYTAKSTSAHDEQSLDEDIANKQNCI